MVAIGLAPEHVVPSVEITTDVNTLAAAFRLAYLAGRADVAREDATLSFLRQTIRNMQRSLRIARPTPREGIEAGLDLMLRAVDERLGFRAEDEFLRAS